MPWPKTVDFVTADDCCKYAWEDQRGRHDVEGWLHKIFVGEHGEGFDAFKKARRTAAQLCCGPVLRGAGGMPWCDGESQSPEDIARLVNRTTATIGKQYEIPAYLEGNPEAKYAGIPLGEE